MQANYYAVIPSTVRYDKRLNFGTRLLYAEITCLCNTTGICWASNEYFCDLYDVTESTISVWIKALVKNGYIKSVLDVTEKGTRRTLSIVDGGGSEKSLEGVVKNHYTGVVKNRNQNINILNNNILNNREELIFPFISELFLSAWNKWKIYKKQEHKFTYKAAVTEQAALKNLEKISEKVESVAIEIIEESIANGYKGLFELKKKGFGSFNQPPKGKYNMQLEEQRRNYKPLEQ